MSDAIQRLVGSLTAYQKADVELIHYRDKAVKSQRDSQSAIDDVNVSEDAVAHLLFKASATAARIKSREQEKERLLHELESSVTAANNELSAAVRTEFFRRRDIVGKRMTEVLGCDPKCLPLGELDQVMILSPILNKARELELKPFERRYTEICSQDPEQFVTTNVGDKQIQELLTIERNPVITQVYDVSHVIGSAEQIVMNFGKLAAMAKEKL
jgi:hypothetical protein